MTQYVIVAGGGHAELLTAPCLAREGTCVTLIEAEDRINDSRRALVVHIEKILMAF
ncbi:hypothetical protein ACTJKQ_22745 [Acidovorax sp. 22279]|uniref:hypothetical protein n=1 Tax=unclassified Acidovorax TaxID=2684926 RepID=UPI00024011E2|nr:hypothetical protein [Acidovorax sp. NO-1]EHL20626.1 hypothetical protein KYG_22261 [Acidovorax sp. NO-1]